MKIYFNNFQLNDNCVFLGLCPNSSSCPSSNWQVSATEAPLDKFSSVAISNRWSATILFEFKG